MRQRRKLRACWRSHRGNQQLLNCGPCNQVQCMWTPTNRCPFRYHHAGCLPSFLTDHNVKLYLFHLCFVLRGLLFKMAVRWTKISLQSSVQVIEPYLFLTLNHLMFQGTHWVSSGLVLGDDLIENRAHDIVAVDDRVAYLSFIHLNGNDAIRCPTSLRTGILTIFTITA